MQQEIPETVLRRVRTAFANFGASDLYQGLVEPREAVLARFQPVFSLEYIPQITSKDFQSFLLFRNNCHWQSLHRQGSRMCSDMPRLREALQVLLDENNPLPDRFNRATGRVRGMGKAVASAILLVAHPSKCGVWNKKSENALRVLGIWPAFDRGDSPGERYEKVNQLLLQLRDELDTDLWTLDGLWWDLNR
jgi:hypothetical protein